jgi:type II secretory pathway pseudopilin PulG
MAIAFTQRRAFTLRDLLVVIAVIAVLLAISVTFIQKSREAARMNQCQNNLKQIGLALLNYADKRRFFPPIASNLDLVPDVPGDATAATPNSEAGTSATSAAGYSWLVFILPEIEESDGFMAVYQSFVASSNKFRESAFSQTNVIGPLGGTSPHWSLAQPRELQCPSFTDGSAVDVSPRTIGGPGILETGTLHPNYPAQFGSNTNQIGITNYHAIAGTHIDQTTKSVSNPNNGGMKFRGVTLGAGLFDRDLPDGASKVPLVCETRERRFSSWYDGTMNWVVAARHSDPANPSAALAAPATLLTESIVLGEVGGTHLPAGRLIIGTDGTPKTGGHALNVGPSPSTPTAVYLPTAALSDPDISSTPPGRLWGPSSMHRTGLVNHVFGDGHVVAISDQIDANMYLWIVTRNGGEPSDAGE